MRLVLLVSRETAHARQNVGILNIPGPTEGDNALIAGSNTGDSWFLGFLFDHAVGGIYFELTDAVERGDATLALFTFALLGMGLASRRMRKI